MSHPSAAGAAAPITLDDEIAAVEREIAMRRASYRLRVATGRMKQAAAQREIALMEAVARRLGTLKGGAP